MLTVKFEFDPGEVVKVIIAVNTVPVAAGSSLKERQLARFREVSRRLIESQVLIELSVKVHDFAFSCILDWTIETALDLEYRAPIIKVGKVTMVKTAFEAPEAVRAELVRLP